MKKLQLNITRKELERIGKRNKKYNLNNAHERDAFIAFLNTLVKDQKFEYLTEDNYIINNVTKRGLHCTTTIEIKDIIDGILLDVYDGVLEFNIIDRILNTMNKLFVGSVFFIMIAIIAVANLIGWGRLYDIAMAMNPEGFVEKVLVMLGFLALTAVQYLAVVSGLGILFGLFIQWWNKR